MSRELPPFLSSFINGLLTAPHTLPSPEARADITTKITELHRALQQHSAWNPQHQHAGLYHVWDFVGRSMYIMSELDNIQQGKPVRHPEQIPRNEGATSNEHAALLSYQDVCTRTATVDDMIQNPRILTMLGMPKIDFGEDIQQKSRAVRQAVARPSGAGPASS